MTSFFKMPVLILSSLILVTAAMASPQRNARWYSYFHRGLLEFRQGNYRDAEKQFQMSCKAALKTGGQSRQLASSLYHLALVQEKQGNCKQALDSLNRTLAIQTRVLHSLHPDILRTVDTLIRLYEKAGNYEEAEHFYRKKLAIEEELFKPGHPRAYRSARSYISFCTEHNLTPYFQSLKPLLATTELPSDPGLADDLKVLAQACIDNKHYDLAESLLKKALAIHMKVNGPDSPEAADIAVSLANTYLNQKKANEAEKLISSVLNSTGAGTSFNTDALKIQLAYIYFSQKNYSKARPIYEAVLKIKEKRHGKSSPELFKTLYMLANLNFKQKRYDQAEALYKRALAIEEKAQAADYKKTGILLKELGDKYYVEQRYKEAANCYKRSADAYKKTEGINGPHVGLSLNNLAFAYIYSGQTEGALPVIKIVLRIYASGQNRKLPWISKKLETTKAVLENSPDYSGSQQAQTLVTSIRKVLEEFKSQ